MPWNPMLPMGSLPTAAVVPDAAASVLLLRAAPVPHSVVTFSEAGVAGANE
jgi:hypothetical protein